MIFLKYNFTIQINVVLKKKMKAAILQITLVLLNIVHILLCKNTCIKFNHFVN